MKCPVCGAELQNGGDEWDSWLECYKCGYKERSK